MLDAVMFVATLVSKSNEVDPQLDRVRTITARRSAGQLTKEDNHTLREVYDYLENYLVKKESLRSFTQESIRDKVYDYLHGNRRQSDLRQPLITMWVIAIGGALVAIIIPESVVPATVKPTLAITIFFVTINLGAAWMFWMGLKNFKDKIRQAYLPICMGVALIGLTLLQAPLVVSIGQDTSVWFHYVTSGLTIPIADALLYVGMRRFAQIGGVTSKLLSGKLIFALCVGLAIFANILPLPDTGVPGWAMATSLTILVTGAVLAVVTARVTALVRQSLSLVYKRPMTWFMIASIISALSCVQYGFLQVIATPTHPYEPQAAALLTLVVSALVTLKAGTSFRQIDTTIVRTDHVIDTVS